jgi:hypothetical protein
MIQNLKHRKPKQASDVFVIVKFVSVRFCGSVLTPAMASGKCFKDLSDELLLKIFSDLNIEDLAMSVQHVNSHWKNVSQDSSLWKNQTFSPGCKMSDEEITRHLRNMPALQAFCPSGGINTKFIVDILCKYCRDIRHIEFMHSHIVSNPTLYKILKKLPHIENLSIPIPEETRHLRFADLLAQFQKLTTLSFTHHYVPTVEDGVLRAIADGCPSLQSLDMGVKEFGIRDVEYFLEKKGQQLLSLSIGAYISTLAHRLLTKCVNLEFLHYECYNADVPGTDIQSLSKLSKLRNLTFICLAKCQARDVSTIFKNQSMSKLITLHLYHDDDFDSTSLTEILTNCPQLQSLSLRCCYLSDYVFQYIGTCKNLQYLDIARANFITDKSMEYVGAGCPNLSHLDIGYCSELTNKSIEYVCSGCQKLKYLNIQNCPTMTDDVLENIFKSKKLEVLVLSCNSHLLGIHFLLIPSNLIHLTELRVDGCLSLDEKLMDKLQEKMPHLLIVGNYTKNE